MGEHLIDGEFVSDKYPWCPPGFVPLKLTDPSARVVLADYARLRRRIDRGFSDDLDEALRLAAARDERGKYVEREHEDREEASP